MRVRHVYCKYLRDTDNHSPTFHFMIIKYFEPFPTKINWFYQARKNNSLYVELRQSINYDERSEMTSRWRPGENFFDILIERTHLCAAYFIQQWRTCTLLLDVCTAVVTIFTNTLVIKFSVNFDICSSSGTGSNVDFFRYCIKVITNECFSLFYIIWILNITVKSSEIILISLLSLIFKFRSRTHVSWNDTFTANFKFKAKITSLESYA